MGDKLRVRCLKCGIPLRYEEDDGRILVEPCAVCIYMAEREERVKAIDAEQVRVMSMLDAICFNDEGGE